MCVARRVHVEIEQLPKIILGEVPSCVFCLIDDASREVLLLTPVLSVRIALYRKI